MRPASANARQRVAVARDPSPAHLTDESRDRAQRRGRPALEAKRVRSDEDARIVHRKRRDVVIEGTFGAVLKEILFDVGYVESAHQRALLVEIGPDGANRFGAAEISADRDEQILLVQRLHESEVLLPGEEALRFSIVVVRRPGETGKRAAAHSPGSSQCAPGPAACRNVGTIPDECGTDGLELGGFVG